MDKQIKKKWIKALESGKYKQTRGQLKGPRGHCCLGVLCDLYCKDTGVDFDALYTGSECLPRDVQEWAELDSDDPVIRVRQNNEDVTLVTLNDKHKKSFKQIAEVIKEKL